MSLTPTQPMPIGTTTAAEPAVMVQGWPAHLALRFDADRPAPSAQDQAADPPVTRLTRREHTGPLRVQKALYPERSSICHATVLHPPSGIAGGDQLHIDVQVASLAHAVLTTPGATRWYKAAGRPAAQHIRLDVASEGKLEWLPAENLLFVDADAQLSLQLHLQPGARTIGWDMVQLGRSACGERWSAGHIMLDNAIYLDGQLLMTESADWWAQQLFPEPEVAAQSQQALQPERDPWLDQWPLFGMLWAVGPALPLHDYEQLAQQTRWDAVLRSGLTRLPMPAPTAPRIADGERGEPVYELLLLRCLATDAQTLRAHLVDVWRALRPPMLDTEPQDLRLWAT